MCGARPKCATFVYKFILNEESMTIKGLVFDFDGLILDTETPQFNTWNDIYKKHQLDLSISLWAKCLGTDHKEFDPLTNLEKETNINLNRDAIHENFSKNALQTILTQPPLPGIIETLDAAQSLGLRVGLASSGDRSWVKGHLTRLNMLDRFECIYTREDVEKVKPDPELFQRAMEHLKIKPEETIVFEDSPNGILAARRAGCFCVAVPNEVSKQLDLSLANLRLKSINELPLIELIKRMMNSTGRNN